MLRSIQKLIGDKRKQLIFPIFLMSLDAIGSLVMYLMLYFTVIHLLNGSLTGGLVRNYTITGHGWGRSGSPHTRSSYGLPSMKLLPNAPPILTLSSCSWRRPASRSSMGAAVRSLFLFRGRSGQPGFERLPSGTVTIPRTSRPLSPGSARSRSSLFPCLLPLAVSI